MAAACGEGRARVWWGRCFIDDRRGSAAVEFGILAIPFFLLVFAIIEVALQFFVAEILDTATSQAARLIRTGEAYHAGMTGHTFKARICANMVALVDCQSHLHIDVQTYSAFADYQATSPVDADGNVVAEPFTAGAPKQKLIIVVRAFYSWPVFFALLPHPGVRTAAGEVLLSSVQAFRTEYFP